MKHALQLFFALLLFFGVYAIADTEILIPQNNTAETLLPTVQSLLEPGGSVSAFQGKLIIKSSAQNIADIKNVLATLDVPARKLLISVRQASTTTASNKGYDVNGRIQVNPNVTITQRDGASRVQNNRVPKSAMNVGSTNMNVGGGSMNMGSGSMSVGSTNMNVGSNNLNVGQTSMQIGSVNINSTNINTQSSDDGEHYIVAMEGYPAFITTGKDVPFVTTSREGNDVNRSVDYKNIDQGFYATARIIGDNQVELDISTTNDQLNPTDRQIIDTQHASTVLSGNLGQWISLGGANLAGNDDSNGRLSSNQQTNQWNSSIYIKVDLQ